MSKVRFETTGKRRRAYIGGAMIAGYYPLGDTGKWLCVSLDGTQSIQRNHTLASEDECKRKIEEMWTEFEKRMGR